VTKTHALDKETQTLPKITFQNAFNGVFK